MVPQVSIHTPANWRLVFKMAPVNGPKMIINVPNRAVLAPEVAIAAALQRLIVRVVLMVQLLRLPQMVMALQQIWARCHHRPAVFSIRHQVSIVIFLILKL